MKELATSLAAQNMNRKLTADRKGMVFKGQAGPRKDKLRVCM